MEPSKLVLCRCFSFSKGVCSGSMLVFRGVNEFSGTEIRVPELLRKNIVIFLGSSAADSKSKNCISPCMGGGFKYVLFSPLLGEMIQFDYIIFLRWAVQPPTRCCFRGIFVVQSLPDPLPRSMFSYLLDPGTIAKARILHEKTQNFPQNKMPLENWLGEDVEIVSRKILRYLFCWSSLLRGGWRVDKHFWQKRPTLLGEDYEENSSWSCRTCFFSMRFCRVFSIPCMYVACRKFTGRRLSSPSKIIPDVCFCVSWCMLKLFGQIVVRKRLQMIHNDLFYPFFVGETLAFFRLPKKCFFCSPKFWCPHFDPRVFSGCQIQMATEPETMPLLKKFIGPTPDVFGVFVTFFGRPATCHIGFINNMFGI